MTWIRWKGKEAADKMRAANRRAVLNTCVVILNKSHTEVPVDEGTLQRSGKVFMAPNDEPAGVVTYGGGPGTGGPAVPYAVRVHETDARYQHGRKSRYLADPFNELAEPTLKEQIGIEAKSEFGE